MRVSVPVLAGLVVVGVVAIGGVADASGPLQSAPACYQYVGCFVSQAGGLIPGTNNTPPPSPGAGGAQTVSDTGGGGGPSQPPCVYYGPFTNFTTGPNAGKPFYSVTCSGAQGPVPTLGGGQSAQNNTAYYPAGGSAPVAALPPPSPAQLAGELVPVAEAQVPLAAPTIGMAPPGGHQIVQDSTWLWTKNWPAPHTAVATNAFGSSTVTVTPIAVNYNMGNIYNDNTGTGDTMTCDGPGTVWSASIDPTGFGPDPSGCSFTYHYSSADQSGAAYQLSAAITYRVTYTETGVSGATAGDYGNITGQATTMRSVVGQVEALNVNPPCLASNSCGP